MVDANQPADGRHDPLAYAAEMIERQEHEDPEEPETQPEEPATEVAEAPPAAPEPTPEPTTGSPAMAEQVEPEPEPQPPAEEPPVEEEALDPRSRRRNAKSRRQALVEKRKSDRAAARALASSKRHARDR